MEIHVAICLVKQGRYVGETLTLIVLVCSILPYINCWHSFIQLSQLYYTKRHTKIAKNILASTNANCFYSGFAILLWFNTVHTIYSTVTSENPSPPCRNCWHSFVQLSQLVNLRQKKNYVRMCFNICYSN